MAKYTVKQFKSILNIRKGPDNWFWEKYGINSYNGCEHGCIYCDSRSAKYFLPTDFENNIMVKNSVKDMLEARLAKARSILPDIVGMSGASDPYHMAEQQFQNTRQCLEVLEKYKFPVHILTKSSLVLRDLDLLKQIATNNWSCVSVTITTADEGMARFLEPGAPSPEKRFEIIQQIKKVAPHIQSGVLLMPVVPFFTDEVWQLEELVKRARESGADYILFAGGMTMRNMQALYFLKKVKEKFPHLLPKYEALYGFIYSSESYEGQYISNNDYTNELNLRIWDLCRKYDLPLRIKRFIPDDFRKYNYIISEKLLNKAYESQLSGNYNKDSFWAGMNIQQLKEPIQSIYQKGEIEKIKGINKETERFIVAQLKNELKGIETSSQMKLFD